jgi:hypothetical protein
MGVGQSRHSDRNLGSMRLCVEALGKVRSKHELGILIDFQQAYRHSQTHQHPVTTVEPGLDGCLLLQLLSVMRYFHHPRHVLNDTH